jgi:hypothetical protein
MDIPEYDLLKSQNINTPMVKYNYILTDEEIKDFFINNNNRNVRYHINKQSLDDLNLFLCNIYKKLASYLNVFQLIEEIERYSILEQNYISAYKTTILANQNNSLFDLYEEILVNIVVEIQQKFIIELKNKSIRNINTFINNVLDKNDGLNNFVIQNKL